MADLRLPDAVNAAEALLQAIRVPGQVVVHHQVGVLEVDAFAGGIGGDENSHIGVGAEQRLEAAAFVAVRAAMNRDDRVGVAEHAGDPLMQVVQRVAVFGEDDELPLPPGGVVHLRIVLEDFREFIPLAVLAGGDDGLGLLLEPLEDDDLRLQFGDRLGGSRLVDQRLLEVLLLLGGQFVVVVRYGAESLGERSRAAIPELLVAQAALEPLSASLERLVDGLGAGGEAPLQGGEREADGALCGRRAARRPCPSPS